MTSTHPDFPELPDFLRIPAAERAEAWRLNPPRRATAGAGPTRRKPSWWNGMWPLHWLDDPEQYAALKAEHATREAKKAERLEMLRARREAP